MTEELKQIIQKWRDKGIDISDDEAKHLLWCCNRKMDLNGIENREEYLPLLYEDEVRNYLLRQSVNAVAVLRMVEANGLCAQSV